MCPWVVHAPNVRHVRPSQLSWTVLQLSWPTFGVNVFLDGTCTECETCETTLSWTVLNYPGPPLWCKCVPWVVHAPNVRHVRPSPSWTVLNYPGPLWCKCVPWGTCTECETCETIPTILDCPQLSWPTFGVSGSWVHAPNVRHVRPSPTILDCPQLSWPHLGVNVFLGYMHRM
jgi:hypothetical protein